MLLRNPSEASVMEGTLGIIPQKDPTLQRACDQKMPDIMCDVKIIRSAVEDAGMVRERRSPTY